MRRRPASADPPHTSPPRARPPPTSPPSSSSILVSSHPCLTLTRVLADLNSAMHLNSDIGICRLLLSYPVVIITCAHYLGPPGPFSFPDSRDLLEVLGGLSWSRERPQGGSPRVREDPLGTPLSLSAKKVSENLEKVPRIWEGEGPGGPR